MAHLVQKVAIALLVCGTAAGQSDRPFSHRTHLKLKLECIACHKPATTSTKASDNLLPTKEACQGCHQQMTVRTTPTGTLVTKFNHQHHLKLGNVAPVIAAAIRSKTYLSGPGDMLRHLNTKNACAACHRGMEESDAGTYPLMADCLVCHTKIEPPFSCTKCHEPDAPLKPASHDKEWLDFHSSGKANLDKPSCVVCHGRRFTCLGCH